MAPFIYSGGSMPVSAFIAHQIDRPNGAEPASVSFRDDLMTIDDHASQLLNELKQVFATRTSKRYGRFDRSAVTIPSPACCGICSINNCRSTASAANSPSIS